MLGVAGECLAFGILGGKPLVAGMLGCAENIMGGAARGLMGGEDT